MKQIWKGMVLAASVTLAPTVQAGALVPMSEEREVGDTLDYDALVVVYSLTDLENVSDDLIGYSVGITRSVYDDIFIGVSYQQGSADLQAGEPIPNAVATSLDSSTIVLGGGFHMQVRPRMDAIFNVSWVSARQETQFKIDDTGIAAGVGLRHRVRTDFEYSAALRHIRVFDASDG